MSTQLEALKIPIMQGFKKENLQPRPDLVIVGNVVSKSNPEAEALLASDIPYTSLPKALGEFVIADRESFVIAGTHGKTTRKMLELPETRHGVRDRRPMRIMHCFNCGTAAGQPGTRRGASQGGSEICGHAEDA